MKRIRFFPFSLIIALFSCSGGAKNYSDAQLINIKNQQFIKLKGKRVLMVHDLISIFMNKTYEDSILIPIPQTKNGIIHGSSIPVESGSYKYRGDIVIQNNTLQIRLSYDDTDDKKLVPFDWNGAYNIIN